MDVNATSTRFFRRAVWLPMVVPLPHAIWYYFAEVRPAQLDWTDAFGLSVVHGVLYAAFALILSRRERDADERRALRLLWIAPAVYAPILASALLVASVLMQIARGVIPAALATLGALGVFLISALAMGYALAGLIYFLYVGVRRTSPAAGATEVRAPE